MAIEYEFKTDTLNRKIAYRVDDNGKKSKINYKIALRRDSNNRSQRAIRVEKALCKRMGLDRSDIIKKTKNITDKAQKDPTILIKTKQTKTKTEQAKWIRKTLIKESDNYVVMRYLFLAYTDKGKIGVESPVLFAHTKVFRPGSIDTFVKAIDEANSKKQDILDQGYVIATGESGICVRWLYKEPDTLKSGRKSVTNDLTDRYEQGSGCFKAK